jgi:hypothetical protein
MTVLKDEMPSEFMNGSYDDTAAFQLRDVEVVEVFGRNVVIGAKQTRDIAWPGPHKNVHHWVKLINGKAVGWNENPARGWSFPVFTLKNDI